MTLEDLDGTVFYKNPKKDAEVKSLINLHEDFNFPEKSGIKTLKTTILRFIILQYDKNTPLRVEYPNFYRMKMNAALMAGFKRNAKTGLFSNSVTEILKGENEDVNKAIIRYVMQFFDVDYLMLITWHEILGSSSAKLMAGSKDGKALMEGNVKAIKQIRDEINSLEEKIFGGKESRELEKELYRALEVEKEALHPDQIAKMISDQGMDDIFKEVDDG